MSHKKIWLAIREVEDQHARDYKRIDDSMAELAKVVSLEVDLRRSADDVLARRVTKRVTKMQEVEALRLEDEKAAKGRVAWGITDSSDALSGTTSDRRDYSAISQINYLANYILEEIPGEPCKDGGAGDTAVHLLKKYRAALQEVIEATPLSSFWVARNALGRDSDA